MAVAILLASGLLAIAIASHPQLIRAKQDLFGNAPSVDVLVANFRAHPRQFASLVRMSSADPEFSLVMTEHGAYLESAYAQALTQARIKQYESRLRPIGGLYLGSSPGYLSVTLGRTGIVVGGDTWGYCHAKQPPAAVVSYKQAHAVFHDPWCYALGDDWYVFNINN